MRTALPDKWVRKAISDRIHNIDVSGNLIPCFDANTANYIGDYYTILSSQTNVQTSTKCNKGWRSTILIEFFTRHKKNHGSRVFVDDILNEALIELEDLSLDAASGMRIDNKTVSTPNDITQKTRGEVIHRKFLRFELLIN